VGEHLGAVDLEAFDELDVGTGDDLFSCALRSCNGSFRNRRD